MPALDRESLDRWREMVMVDEQGVTVGTISELYLDRETSQPTWVLVSMGLSGAKRSFVPLTEAAQHGSEIAVPYPKALIREAPRIEADGQLTPDEEAALFAHYGLDYRAATGEGGPRPGRIGVFDQEQPGARQPPEAHDEPPEGHPGPAATGPRGARGGQVRKDRVEVDDPDSDRP